MTMREQDGIAASCSANCFRLKRGFTRIVITNDVKTRLKTQNFHCWILLWCVWICRNKHTNNRMGWWEWATVSRDVWTTIHSTLTFTPFGTLECWLHGRRASFVWRPRRHRLLKMGLYHLPQSCNGFTSLFPLCKHNRGGISSESISWEKQGQSVMFYWFFCSIFISALLENYACIGKTTLGRVQLEMR